MDYHTFVLDLAKKTKEASYQLETLSTDKKNKILKTIFELLETNKKSIIEANQKDIELGKQSGLSDAMLDRLLLNEKRIQAMRDGVQTIIQLADPVGEIIESRRLPNNLFIAQKRIPLGVVAMIYESRPNVTIDASALCIKSGNAVILRGGKEALNSNSILVKIIREAIIANGLNPNMVSFIDNPDRELMKELLKLDQFIDVVIPRGGEGLIRFTVENSRIPVIKHDKGVCAVYVHHDAKKEMAESIVINAKTQRPGVCNAIENLFIHKHYPYTKELLSLLHQKGVELRGYGEITKIVPFIKKLEDMQEFGVEYLDLILSVKIVENAEEAIDLIRRYGSGHSDAIVTENYTVAMDFLNQVNSATVYVNASTRFTDGFEFGLGAEMGISTNKLHARGPVALKEMTTYKYIILGEGQIRN